MDQWTNKVVLLTEADSQIGSEICRQLCRHQVVVVGLTAQLDQLNSLGESIHEDEKETQFHAVQCDLANPEEVRSALEYVAGEFGGVDVLITVKVEDKGGEEEDVEDSEEIPPELELTKKVLQSMVESDTNGYIININCRTDSVVEVVEGNEEAQKNNLRNLCESSQPKIKMSKITADNVTLSGGEEENPTPSITAQDVAHTVVYCLSTPRHVQIKEIRLGSSGGDF